MKRYVLLTCLFLWQFTQIYAQQVKGGVFEMIGGESSPLIGANVVQLNTLNGTTTDAEGHFNLNLERKAPKKLVVSYVSYQSDTINLNETGFGHVHVTLNNLKNLDEVEVVSRKSGSHISRTETRGIISINEGELQKAACCNLSESFENSASVDVSYADAVTGAKQIQLLGLAGLYTQMLTENIPNLRGLAIPYRLGYVPGSWMESIQVSKGTSSVINGYESMAGQINIEYKKPDEGEKFFLNLYGNQMGKMEGNLNTRFEVNDKWSTMILAHAEYFGTKHDDNDDSFMDDPLIEQVNLFNRWKYKGDNLRLQFGIQYLTENRQGGQMNFDPGEPHDTENGYGIGVETDRYLGFFKMGYILKNRDKSSIGFQNQVVYHDVTSFYGLNDYNADQFSYYGNLMFQSYINDTRHQYTTGISFSLDNYNQQLNDTSWLRDEQVAGGFFQYTYSNFKNLNIIAGLRLDHNNLYGWLFTPRLHAKYNINEHNVLRLSFGRGYRTANVIAENTSILATSKQIQFLENLNIESSWNFGLTYTAYIDIGSRELTITTDYFYTKFDNQVILDREEDPFIVYIYNLDGPSYSNSIQVEAQYEPINRFELKLAFRYNDVKTTIGNELQEKPFVSKYIGLLSASYQTNLKKWQFDMNLQINGDQRLPYTGFNPEIYQSPERSPVYAILNAQVTKYFKRWDVYIGGENLTSYKQNNPIIQSYEPFGEYFDSSMVWGPVSGIKVYAGIRFTIK
jgi:outer membrane receptor for ferrienterochelin and colicin